MVEKENSCLGVHHLAKATFLLRNNPALIGPLVELVKQMVANKGLCNSIGRLQIGIALSEAILNAIFHGNLRLAHLQTKEIQDRLIEEKDIGLVNGHGQPSYEGPRVYVGLTVTPEEATFVIRDEGPGFDVAMVPEPDDPRAFEPERGRGLVLMRSLMDEVTFNDTGNEVTMVKRRRPTVAPVPAQEPCTELPRVFSTDIRENTLIVVVLGSAGSLLAAQIRAELEDILGQLEQAEVRDVVVDCAKAPYFGSSVLQAIHTIWKHVSAAGGRLALCNLSDRTREILHVSRFDTLWPVYASQAEALEATKH